LVSIVAVGVGYGSVGVTSGFRSSYRSIPGASSGGTARAVPCTTVHMGAGLQSEKGRPSESLVFSLAAVCELSSPDSSGLFDKLELVGLSGGVRFAYRIARKTNGAEGMTALISGGRIT